MMRLPKLFRKNKSFTLVELIMTIVVVGIVALPISVILTKHVQSVFVSQDYTCALNLARLEMEKVLNTPYGSISSASFSNYQGYAYDLTCSVSYLLGAAPPALGLKQIIISVTKAQSAQVLVTLKTYVVSNVTWGL
ncbi:MAG: type II secretion system protein [Candidatus Omnitrophota bacterium]